MLPAALKYFKRSKTSRIFMNDELNKQWYIVQKKQPLKMMLWKKKMTEEGGYKQS